MNCDFRVLGLLLTAAVGATAGCDPSCAASVDCLAPTLQLEVVDAQSGSPLTDVTANLAGTITANRCAPNENCTLAFRTSVSGTVTVTAEGYKPLTFIHQAAKNSCGDVTTLKRRIELQPSLDDLPSTAGAPEKLATQCH